MTKFYVRCGDIRKLILAKNARKAADKIIQEDISERIKSLNLKDGEETKFNHSYDEVITVSERGFDNHDDDVIFQTAVVIYNLEA